MKVLNSSYIPESDVGELSLTESCYDLERAESNVSEDTVPVFAP